MPFMLNAWRFTRAKMKIIRGMRHFNLSAIAISRGKKDVFLTKTHFWLFFPATEHQ